MALFDLPLDQLEKYAPAVPEPKDFEEFWKATLDEAAGWPVLLGAAPVATDLSLVDTWDVTFSGFGGDPVRAWFTRPARVTDPLPAVVEFVGYGRG
ncbi:MAG TPA: acetylxylan esterase, partial [Candidatus Limnocylindrales bacterium]|nr:acetylxylan esterase [Candidatus Limnocylindrales bacterium]